MPDIIPATQDHAVRLSGNLRAADVAELEASALSPEEGLVGSLLASGEAAWAVVEEGEPLALFGAADCTSLMGVHCGAPWLLGSDALVTTHRRWLLRNTQRIVQTPDAYFHRYFNRVDARNTAHVRWLRWAGFMVMEPVPWGPFRLPFHPFFRKAPNV
ncbi:MAG TPA: hypothetical protein VNR89_04070 [Roseomonas sp.]|nr:hypothetical protein [Roseomonas sp.]